MPEPKALTALLKRVEACRECEAHLPLGPRPVVQISAKARILIVGQAPGTAVHESGVPWDDKSGDQLRTWLSVSREQFYDPAKFALMPMGFCYPGRTAKGGDARPRPECAPLWHSQLSAQMPRVKLTLLTGMYAQAHYLAERRKKTLAETVKAWRDYAPEFLPTPHPSWRSISWMKRNPWFEEGVLPWLRRRVKTLLR
ncbi:MAG: uracil-DNA glycosylase family protein [Planctomycetes bacterium]|nr:uracil-DNA glycosylase family protein [Planctomycetota bacterium]